MNTTINKPLWLSLFYTKNKDDLQKELDIHKNNNTNLIITINNKDNIDNDFYYTNFIMNLKKPISDEFSYFSNRYNNDNFNENDDNDDELIDTIYDDNDLENLDTDYDLYKISNYFSDYNTDSDTDLDNDF
jgi:hypothetical protein